MSESILNLPFLLRLVRDTVSDPKEGAAMVIELAPPRQARWLMFALVVVLSMMLAELVTLTPFPGAGEGGQAGGMTGQGPIAQGLLQAAILFVMAHAITQIGRLFGGIGQFDDALILVIWLQFIILCLQGVQLLALLVLPPLAGLIMIVALGLFFWLLVNFIAVLHGFTSVGTVFLMTILSIVAFLVVLSLGLALLGVEIDGVG